MNNTRPDKDKVSDIFSSKRLAPILLALLTFVIAVSLSWNIINQKKAALESARIRAKTVLEKDILFRRWNAMLGGVYAPVSDETQPNPYLEGVVGERDLKTPSGRELTLVNPEFMTRQVLELEEKGKGVLGHLTSLQPIRKENAADPWEKEALLEFEKGAKEVSSLEMINGGEYMRLMRPLVTEEECLKCHKRQGYRKGDIRGGLSVSVPMEPHWDAFSRSAKELFFWHIFLWLCAAGVIYGGYRHQRRAEDNHERAVAALRESEYHMQCILGSTADGILAVDSHGKVIQANRRFADMWRIPQQLLNTGDDKALLNFVLEQLADPEAFLRKVKMLYGTANEDMDTLVFKDGRIFERYSFPLMMEGFVKGRVWSFRDSTERKQREEERETLLRWKEGVNLLQRSLLAPAAIEQKLKIVTDGIVSIFDADFCRIWMIRPGDLCGDDCIHAGAQEGPHICRYRDRCLHLLASSGHYTHIDGKVHRRVPFGCYKIGLIASGEAHKLVTNDVQNDPRIHNREWAREIGLVSFAGYQLRVPDGRTIGVMAVFAKHPVSAAEDAMLDGLSGAVALVIQQAAAEEALKKSEEFNRNILESVDEGFIIIDRDYRIISANRAFADEVRMPVEKIIGEHCYEISHHCDTPCNEAGEICAVKEVFETGKPQTAVHTHYNSEGKQNYIETKAYPLSRDESGRIMTVIEILVDITEKKKLEEQLRHAQKMEAVGTLAGGIAHDFNNILNVIMGYSNMVRDRMEAGSLSREQMNEVLTAAERAANLTRGLLAFSRKQVVEVKLINVNDIILGIQKMLVRIIRENIDFKLKLTDSPLVVMADAVQIEQVLMNLATNAKDAMPEGGHLTISTGLEEIDDEYIAVNGYGTPGMYALITVTDTGHGMGAETQKKIFEPFFTTKGIGKGSGLGLAISYGIIKQHNGYIHVYSELEKGTTFKILLPIIEESAIKKREVEESVPVNGGSETILVAEDDAAVRNLSRIVLEAFGYTVITAADGEDAITRYRENMDDIRLVILDVVMPNKNGKEAYAGIKNMKPDVKAIFFSGYTMDAIHQKELLDEGMGYIPKPFSPKDLLKKVREILDK